MRIRITSRRRSQDLHKFGRSYRYRLSARIARTFGTLHGLASAAAARRRCQRIMLPCSRSTPIACSACRSLLRDTLTDSSDPPALASREARFEVLRRVSLAVAISDLSPQESKESSTESSHHKQEVREHRQPGTHSTIAIPASTEYTTLYTRHTTVKG